MIIVKHGSRHGGQSERVMQQLLQVESDSAILGEDVPDMIPQLPAEVWGEVLQNLRDVMGFNWQNESISQLL